MARGIQQTDVDRACDELVAAGVRPNAERIRQHVGSGSPNTIGPMLDVWWKSLAQRLAAQASRVAMPEAPEAVAVAATQLWALALEAAGAEAAASLGEERSALAAARLETDARVAAAQQVVEAAQTRASEAAAALQTAHDRLEDRQRLVDRQGAQIEDLTRQRDQALLRSEQLTAELAELRARLDGLAGEAEAERERQAAHVRAVEDRAHGEVDRARQESRELKVALQGAEKAHSAQLRAIEGDLAQARAAGAAAVRDLAIEQARRETLEQQLAEVHRRLESALKPAPVRRAAPSKTKRARARKVSASE